MSRSSALILLGILTILIPVSGLPATFRTFLNIAFGAGVIGIGLLMRTSNKPQVTGVIPLPTEKEPLPTPSGVSPI